MARDRVASVVADRTRAFAQQLSWSLHVPGQHAGGVSYDELLGYLAAQGRDFLADSRSLRAHVKLRLQARFEGYQRAPNATELKREAAAAILEWVLARFDRKVRDVPIKANSVLYIKWKIHHDLDSRPGQATGELRDAIESDGDVTVQG